MEPFYFEAKSKEEANIHIYGPIGWNNQDWGDGTNNTAYALVSLIKKLDKEYKRINVHINSPGGIIDEGLAIYNTLKQAQAEIHTYNSGLTASMASIIMLAGTTHMPKTSIFHLHSASTIAIGNIKDFEQVIADLKVFESVLQQAISDKTGMEIKDIQKKWFDGAEHFMTSAQAGEFGFVDVVEEGNSKPPAAIDQLENMKFRDIVKLYENSKEPTRENGILEKLKSLFNSTNNNKKSDKMGKLVFRAKLTLLLALIGLQEFVLNAENKVEMDIDDAYKINDALESRDAEINSLKQNQSALEQQITDLQAQLAEKQALIDKTPQQAANPLDSDNSGVGADGPQNLSGDVSEKLKAYNKKIK